MLKKINNILVNNMPVIKNMLGAFGVKGASLVVSFILLPLYIRFLHDKATLGLWYTILSVLSWVTLFDLGLGHGLRNRLPDAFEKRDINQIRKLISTTYVLMLCTAGIVLLIGEVIITRLNWNSIFNVEDTVISNGFLTECVSLVFIGVIINMILKIVTSILYAMQYSAIVNFLTLIPNIIILIALCVMPSRTVHFNLKAMSVVNVCAINIPYLICSWFVFKYFLKGNFPSFRFFAKECIKDIFSIGISLLWLQEVFMVISSANELIITRMTGPDHVVEYQIYNKIFKTAGMVVSLSLTPIWSAVTKAQAQKKFVWIRKVYEIFFFFLFMCILLELCIIPFLPWIIDVWIGPGAVEVHIGYAVVFSVSNAMMVLHSVNTAVGNGLSYFKVQMIWMTFAAFVFIPLSYCLVQLTGSLIGVVIANTISLMPYEFLAPAFTMRELKRRQVKVSTLRT